MGTLFAMHGIGYALQEQSRYDEAEQQYRRTLAAIEAAPGLAQLRLRVLNNLARVYIDKAWYSQAERVLVELSNSRELRRLPEEAALYHGSLASLELRRGRLSKAEASAREGLATLEKTLGTDNRSAAGLFNTLGLIVAADRRAAEAAGLHERAQQIFTAFSGPDTPFVARALLNKSVAKLQMGQATEADQEAADAVAIFEKYFGANHPVTARALMARAAALRRLRKNTEAKRLEKRGKRIQATEATGDLSGLVVDVSALMRAEKQ